MSPFRQPFLVLWRSGGPSGQAWKTRTPAAFKRPLGIIRIAMVHSNRINGILPFQIQIISFDSSANSFIATDFNCIHHPSVFFFGSRLKPQTIRVFGRFYDLDFSAQIYVSPPTFWHQTLDQIYISWLTSAHLSAMLRFTFEIAAALGVTWLPRYFWLDIKLGSNHQKTGKRWETSYQILANCQVSEDEANKLKQSMGRCQNSIEFQI